MKSIVEFAGAHLELIVTFIFVGFVVFGYYFIYRFEEDDLQKEDARVLSSLNISKIDFFHDKNLKVYKNDYAKTIEYLKIIIYGLLLLSSVVAVVILYHYDRWHIFVRYGSLAICLCLIYIFNSSYIARIKLLRKHRFYIVEYDEYYVIDVLLKYMPHLFSRARYTKVQVRVEKKDIVLAYKSTIPILDAKYTFENRLKKDFGYWVYLLFTLLFISNMMRLLSFIPFMILHKPRFYVVCESKDFVFSLPYDESLLRNGDASKFQSFNGCVIWIGKQYSLDEFVQKEILRND